MLDVFAGVAPLTPLASAVELSRCAVVVGGTATADRSPEALGALRGARGERVSGASYKLVLEKSLAASGSAYLPSCCKRGVHSSKQVEVKLEVACIAARKAMCVRTCDRENKVKGGHPPPPPFGAASTPHN